MSRFFHSLKSPKPKHPTSPTPATSTSPSSIIPSVQFAGDTWQPQYYGPPGTLQYRLILLDRKEREVSPWHDVPLYTTGGQFNVVCKTPRGSWVKYEVAASEDFCPIKVCRSRKGRPAHFSRNATWNYCMFPQTWASAEQPNEDFGGLLYDNKPVDVLEIGTHRPQAGEVYAVKVLGAFAVVEGMKLSWKFVAIAASDPLAGALHDADDVVRRMAGLVDELKDWLRTCDFVDPEDTKHRLGLNERFAKRSQAVQVLAETHSAWQVLVDLLPPPRPAAGSTYERTWRATIQKESADTSAVPLSEPDPDALSGQHSRRQPSRLFQREALTHLLSEEPAAKRLLAAAPSLEPISPVEERGAWTHGDATGALLGEGAGAMDAAAGLASTSTPWRQAVREAQEAQQLGQGLRSGSGSGSFIFPLAAGGASASPSVPNSDGSGNLEAALFGSGSGGVFGASVGSGSRKSGEFALTRRLSGGLGSPGGGVGGGESLSSASRAVIGRSESGSLLYTEVNELSPLVVSERALRSGATVKSMVLPVAVLRRKGSGGSFGSLDLSRKGSPHHEGAEGGGGAAGHAAAGDESGAGSPSPSEARHVAYSDSQSSHVAYSDPSLAHAPPHLIPEEEEEEERGDAAEQRQERDAVVKEAEEEQEQEEDDDEDVPICTAPAYSGPPAAAAVATAAAAGGGKDVSASVGGQNVRAVSAAARAMEKGNWWGHVYQEEDPEYLRMNSLSGEYRGTTLVISRADNSGAGMDQEEEGDEDDEAGDKGEAEAEAGPAGVAAATSTAADRARDGGARIGRGGERASENGQVAREVSGPGLGADAPSPPLARSSSSVSSAAAFRMGVPLQLGVAARNVSISRTSSGLGQYMSGAAGLSRQHSLLVPPNTPSPSMLAAHIRSALAGKQEQEEEEEQPQSGSEEGAPPGRPPAASPEHRPDLRGGHLAAGGAARAAELAKPSELAVLQTTEEGSSAAGSRAEDGLQARGEGSTVAEAEEEQEEEGQEEESDVKEPPSSGRNFDERRGGGDEGEGGSDTRAAADPGVQRQAATTDALRVQQEGAAVEEEEEEEQDEEEGEDLQAQDKAANLSSAAARVSLSSEESMDVPVAASVESMAPALPFLASPPGPSSSPGRGFSEPPKEPSVAPSNEELERGEVYAAAKPSAAEPPTASEKGLADGEESQEEEEDDKQAASDAARLLLPGGAGEQEGSGASEQEQQQQQMRASSLSAASSASSLAAAAAAASEQEDAERSSSGEEGRAGGREPVAVGASLEQANAPHVESGGGEAEIVDRLSSAQDDRVPGGQRQQQQHQQQELEEGEDGDQEAEVHGAEQAAEGAAEDEESVRVQGEGRLARSAGEGHHAEEELHGAAEGEDSMSGASEDAAREEDPVAHASRQARQRITSDEGWWNESEEALLMGTLGDGAHAPSSAAHRSMLEDNVDLERWAGSPSGATDGAVLEAGRRAHEDDLAMMGADASFYAGSERYSRGQRVDDADLFAVEMGAFQEGARSRGEQQAAARGGDGEGGEEEEERMSVEEEDDFSDPDDVDAERTQMFHEIVSQVEAEVRRVEEEEVKKGNPLALNRQRHPEDDSASEALWEENADDLAAAAAPHHYHRRWRQEGGEEDEFDPDEELHADMYGEDMYAPPEEHEAFYGRGRVVYANDDDEEGGGVGRGEHRGAGEAGHADEEGAEYLHAHEHGEGGDARWEGSVGEREWEHGGRGEYATYGELYRRRDEYDDYEGDVYEAGPAEEAWQDDGSDMYPTTGPPPYRHDRGENLYQEHYEGLRGGEEEEEEEEENEEYAAADVGRMKGMANSLLPEDKEKDWADAMQKVSSILSRKLGESKTTNARVPGVIVAGEDEEDGAGENVNRTISEGGYQRRRVSKVDPADLEKWRKWKAQQKNGGSKSFDAAKGDAVKGDGNGEEEEQEDTGRQLRNSRRSVSRSRSARASPDRGTEEDEDEADEAYLGPRKGLFALDKQASLRRHKSVGAEKFNELLEGGDGKAGEGTP
eukprot:jgi/Mesen1/1170/ME000124S00201